MNLEKCWERETTKRRRIVMVLRSQGKKECERRVKISIGARISSNRSGL